MQLDFNGRAGIVTGGASGIGEATARAFAKAGAAVMLADVQADLGEAVAQAIRNEGGRAEFLPCDVSSEADVAAAVAGTVAAFGSLDFAFNNAGVTGTGRKTADYELADWDRLMGINLRGVFLCMKHEIRRMRARGGGAIVNTSSVAGLVGRSGSPAYVSSKHGVVGLTKTAAVEYAEDNIRVNAICPGMIATPMVERFGQADPAARAAEIAKQPMPRLGSPDEIASAVLWLCSPGGAFTTGQAIAIDGGYVAR
jgi:NAD(P)-dependent dehydrogenase (short-subunit alcohol dehydrogenase family)